LLLHCGRISWCARFGPTLAGIQSPTLRAVLNNPTTSIRAGARSRAGDQRSVPLACLAHSRFGLMIVAASLWGQLSRTAETAIQPHEAAASGCRTVGFPLGETAPARTPPR